MEPETLDTKPEFDRIVVGFDDTEPAWRALGRAAQLAKAFSARVIVTSVARPLVPAGHGIGPVDPADSPQLHREQLDRAEAYLATLGVAAECDVRLGEPAAQIVRLANDRHADLIVVGTREPDLIERVLGLSVSSVVERRAHSDVLIVH